MTKVFVSGCFDLLHSGHVQFLETASQYGDLHVSIGSDSTVYALKGRQPIYSEKERLFLVKSLRCVKDAFIAGGSGRLDFVDELTSLHPDVLIVNGDGHSEEKQQLCNQLGIEYLVLERVPYRDLASRSTTEIVQSSRIPYRIDLAGGWLDQPWVSQHAPGAVITISIEPHAEFVGRSGLATSTRNNAIRLWGSDLPYGEPEEMAKILFRYENFPGREFVSGSQDALGIVTPGINRLYYDGGYWPSRIDSVCDDETCAWLERHLCLIALPPRPAGFRVLETVTLSKSRVEQLAAASDACWTAIMDRDLPRLGAAVNATLDAQLAIFPQMRDCESGSVCQAAHI